LLFSHVSMPHISIVIPTYNEEKYLPRLLKQIKQQDFTDYEIIVADNNSKDKTRSIAKRFGARITKEPKAGFQREGETWELQLQKGSA
jgi:glycosyltransferase involved in cell wall biosynthesis